MERSRNRNIRPATQLDDAVTAPMRLEIVQSDRQQPSRLGTHRVALDEVRKAYDTFGSAAKESALRVLLRNHSGGGDRRHGGRGSGDLCHHDGAAEHQTIARFRALRRASAGQARKAPAPSLPEKGKARGKSELRRAVRRVTPGRGNPKDSGTENIQPDFALTREGG